jgi:hypothetical protein
MKIILNTLPTLKLIQINIKLIKMKKISSLGNIVNPISDYSPTKNIKPFSNGNYKLSLNVE